LFRGKEIKGTLTIAPYDSEETGNAVYKFIGKVFDPPDDDRQWSSIIRYSPALNRYVNGTVSFIGDIDNITVTEGDNKGHYITAD
jgi:hypothetical protein